MLSCLLFPPVLSKKAVNGRRVEDTRAGELSAENLKNISLKIFKIKKGLRI